MAHTPLLKYLVRIARRVQAAHPADFALDRSRRAFLGSAGAVLAAGVLPATTVARPADLPTAAIVGGGLAGLSCAYRLKHRLGLNATVYEASTRLGGRCHTDRENFGAQIAEYGGELIDTGHFEIRRLAKQLGLEMDDLLAAQAPDAEESYFFDGEPYGAEDIYQDFLAVLPQLRRDIRDAPFPTTWEQYTLRAQELDAMSIDDWIGSYVPGGLSSRFGQLLSVAYEIEFGASPSDQSALNMLYLLGFSSRRTFEIYGESDERFHIRGGNDLLVTRLAGEIGSGQLRMAHFLTRIAADGEAYRLDFDTPEGPVQTRVDHVVLAIPFSILRSRVDYSAAGFDALKRNAIEEQPMGQNSKLHMQLARRVWLEQGGTGGSYADTGYQASWEVTRAQPGEAGILVNYTGGSAAVAMNQDTPAARVDDFLRQLDNVYPGVSGQWNGRVNLAYWPGNPLTRGSYSYYRPGQYTRFAGYEAVRQGNCHFCGEHTTLEYQGYLNGAVATGEAAADEIRHDILGEG
jgi:monoamine oxidase